MRVSAKGQYACVAMVELAAHYGDPGPTHIKAIAESHGISQRFLVQILLQLKVNGLVESVRGAAGGYHLARPPERISLADVINAIDHPPPPAPTALRGLLPSLAVRALSAVLQEVQAKEQEMLEETTLADLVRRTAQSGTLSYQI
jgi:Rrf2 family transcriptional regulator, cysteine metabolism repressor